MAKVLRRHGVLSLGGASGVPDAYTWKFSARLAAAADTNIASCPAFIDGFDMSTAITGDRILLPNQTDPIENGIRVFGGVGSALPRSGDMDDSTDIAAGAVVMILQGNSYADEQFKLLSDFPIPDTDPMNFGLFTANPTVEMVTKNASFLLTANDNGKGFVIDASGGNVVVTVPVLFVGFNATFLREDDGTNDITFTVSSTTLKATGGANKIVSAQNGGASILFDIADEFYLKGELVS